MPPGLAALAVTQLAYGGLLFAFTLYLQSGLGDSAQQARLTYVPMATTFGVVGYCWRRLPAGASAFIVPADLTVSTLAYLGIAASVPGGIQGGFLPFALAAAGMLTTTVQLGQLMGVAVLGSVYLSRAATRAAATHAAAAMSGTAVWLAVLSAEAMPAALIMVRGVSRRPASS